jgi:hypothetical protein
MSELDEEPLVPRNTPFQEFSYLTTLLRTLIKEEEMRYEDIMA